jgi:hypothetical protein
MNYTDFDPYMIKERNEQMLREVKALQLGKQLRKNREPRSTRVFAFARRGALLLQRVRVAR